MQCYVYDSINQINQTKGLKQFKENQKYLTSWLNREEQLICEGHPLRLVGGNDTSQRRHIHSRLFIFTW